MTLSGIPSQRSGNLTNRRDSIIPSPKSGSGNVLTTKNGQRPIPKSRKSMIPTLGRENIPTNTIDSNNGDGKNKSDANNSSAATSVRKIPKVRRSSIIPQNQSTVVTNNNDNIPMRNNTTSSNGNSDRRGSILPPPPPFPHAHGMMKQEKDPRIVSDNKPLQQKCIRDLLDYLLDNGYQYPVSQKSLSRPSAKEFSNILTFMLRRVDPNFQNNSQMKFEDEVALNFKCLGYPCSISKTALVAAGTAHTWPSLLAALTWLMERLQCIELDKEEDMLHNPQGTTFESIEELVIKSETAFYQYLGKSYAAFLTENMQELEHMEVALSNRFMKDDEVLEQHIERITDVNTTIVEKIRQLEHESAEYVYLILIFVFEI
jgi:kinetochore protein NDC80